MICFKDLFAGHEDPGSPMIRFSAIAFFGEIAILLYFSPPF
jgi:hypothetical protein